MRSPRITRITQADKGMVSAFLLDTPDDGVIVIDALSDGDAQTLLRGLTDIGRTPQDVRHIILTHSHRSHIGGAARLRELSGGKGGGATVWAHAAEQGVIVGEEISPPTVLLPRRPYHLGVYKLQLGLTGGHYFQKFTGARPRALAAPPCEVDAELVDQGTVGPLHAQLTPGHSRGSMSLYWPEERALFTGDALVSWPRLEIGWRGLTLDNPLNRRSLAELAGMGDIEWIGVGHGEPVVDDAAEKVRRLLGGLVTENGRAVLDTACERGLCGP